MNGSSYPALRTGLLMYNAFSVWPVACHHMSFELFPDSTFPFFGFSVYLFLSSSVRRFFSSNVLPTELPMFNSYEIWSFLCLLGAFFALSAVHSPKFSTT